MTGHGLTGLADAGAFLARVARFDPGAVVRLRPVDGAGRTALWARLPWDVLVVRTVTGLAPVDVTVGAADLLARLAPAGGALPPRRDADWRWPLPPMASRRLELIPAAQLWQVAEAAAGTLRTAAAEGVAGRAVGQRVLRDALLDHVAVTVRPDDPPGEPVEVTQRLVQAIVRMGFAGPPPTRPAAAGPGAAGSAPAGPAVGGDGSGSGAAGGDVQVRSAGRWVGLVGPYGAAWSRTVSELAIRPTKDHPKG
ncbi:hypothetical protein ACFY3U_21085 [Micromonospora sp. NPDC000089]|uniref:hypothetical protein n=1 Tax=unclassified Micromonospora TaxID=2617518 RepID=UPI00367F72B9